MKKYNLNDFILTKVREITYYKAKCECGFVNIPDNFYKICPLCGNDLYGWHCTEIIE